MPSFPSYPDFLLPRFISEFGAGKASEALIHRGEFPACLPSNIKSKWDPEWKFQGSDGGEDRSRKGGHKPRAKSSEGRDCRRLFSEDKGSKEKSAEKSRGKVGKGSMLPDIFVPL